MRTTGIVRRIDDLGRIAIPKEIRQTLNIKEGDPLEMFVDEEGLILQPYEWTITKKIQDLKEIICDYIDPDKSEEMLNYFIEIERLVEEDD